MRRCLVLFAGLLLLSGCAKSSTHTRLVLAATTTLEDTGLLDLISAEFKKAHPAIELSPIAVGTGEAIALGKRGDADVLISHDSVAEMELVSTHAAKERLSLMQNDFVIAAPSEDPAHIKGRDPINALREIARTKTLFISRGDDSGTHRKEMKLWQETGIEPAGDWYVEAAVGMGDALLLAGQKRGYILTDRATYLRFKPRVNLEVLCEGDARLLNRYGVTVMNGPLAAEAERFAEWITSAEVQRKIGEFGRAEFGRSLFVPTAHGAASRDTIPTGER